MHNTTQINNPLLPHWTGPYNGIPPFDQVKVEDFKPALEAAMIEQLAETQRIADNPEPATFANTIEALERTGKTLDEVGTLYGVWSGNMKDAAFAAVEKEMAPKLAEFSDKISQNEALFKRIEAVYNSDKSALTPEQQRLSWFYYNNFVRRGAKLDAGAKKRVSAINQELAGLFTRFSQNILEDETDDYVVLEHEEELAGLSQQQIDAAAEAAAEKKEHGWVIPNSRSFVDPFLSSASNREAREKVWRKFVNRGDNGGETDNNAIITKILKLRAERAKLLGYATHAHWRLENTMAKTPENAMELMETVWAAAVKRVHEEVADMQALANKEGADFEIHPWDYKYYAEKVRKQRFDLDQEEIKQYLQLDKLREGMFWVAGELFNFSFDPIDNVPIYHPDVKVWEVKDKATGRHIGLFYFDPYARQGKRSGAWMSAYRSQEKLSGDIPTIVSNNSNFVKSKPGEPILISWDDATTLFHEFGHALHGLSSNVTYPSLSGTSVVRDYVEFPSQLTEHWLATPEVLERFALHCKTGKPIPKELIGRVEKASTFNQGFATTEFLASALIDMKLHLAGDTTIDPDKFEKDTLDKLGMPKEIVMRHRTPAFLHVFSSDGYSAGYYSYLWADVLVADAWSAFMEGTGPYDKAVADKLMQYVLSRGNSVEPSESYRAFRGRDPETKALMAKRGLTDVEVR